MSTQSNGFGPWSTALDNGMRMQLSAFWRQRMAGLSRLPLGRRLSRRWAACGIIATLLLAATPLVELSSQVIAEEKPSAAQDATPKAGDEFVWRFSNGLEVELIGLAKNPSKDEAWWRPDGSPLPDASLPRARYRSGDGGGRELAFRWRNVDDNSDQTRLWHTLPPYGGAGGGVSEKEGDSSILEVTGVTFTSGLKAATVTFTASVSSTPWKKAFETDGRSASSTGLMMDGKPLSAAFTTAYETKTGIAITASYGLSNQSGRLVLFDVSGKESLPTRQSGVGSTHFTQTTFEFDGVALADVDRLELQTQTRALETIEFRNVSLEAGHATKVVIEPYKAADQGDHDARNATSAASHPDAEAMSLEEALKIVRPAKDARVEVSEEVERQASNRVAREEQKLLLELVESGAFTLEPGELVKFVPASESGESRRKLAFLRDDKRRLFFFFKPPAGEVPSLSGSKYDDMNLMDAIEDVLGLPIQNVEGRDQTLAQELPEGDWICSWDRNERRAPLDRQLVAAFEKTLKGVFEQPVPLSIDIREIPVLFAVGAYHANPIIDEKWSMPALSPEAAKTADGPFVFPARRGTTVSMVSDFQGMREMIGALLLTPIVDKSSPGPTKESYFMTFAEPPQVHLHEPLGEVAKQAVIDAFEKQTSLTLTPGRREMAVLVVGDGKSN